MPPSDRTFRVPHDLAHFAVEGELGMRDGVFGTVMAGGLFDKMQIIAGRRRHDDRQRSAAVVRANTATRAVAVAEVLAGVVHRAVEAGTQPDLYSRACEQWGIVRQDPFPFTPEQLASARCGLSELAEEWTSLDTGSQLTLRWTVPVARRGRGR
ncbi:MAG: hypothetical protein ACR2JQ_11425 [Mycobacteriales bacterium]